ncbi:MAG: HAD hydrolase-like protein [Planctomycetes bacterium]|jgi:phosphoglycolate phosphatase-like HAD superfamily hydrolase|nr:HAD hydrolase-like protein [Planctomycetota bacterium]
MTATDPAQPLKDFQPAHGFFVGIDSDGSVFDTMGLKQRECFCPWMIGHFGLQPVAAAARECREFADLFSKTRGANRHKTLKRILAELLPNHPTVKGRKFKVPQLPHYFAWVDDPDNVHSNEGLKQALGKAHGEARQELERVLAWSERVDWAVREIVKGVPPFSFVRESLQKLQGQADVVVLSTTPGETVLREWNEHDITKSVALIAGQEMGAKALQLQVVTKGRYKENHVLMVGDAPDDLKAAKALNALFYPIIPGGEDEAWRRLHNEALDRFFRGQYAGAYERKLVDEFERRLPERPPWVKW